MIFSVASTEGIPGVGEVRPVASPGIVPVVAAALLILGLATAAAQERRTLDEATDAFNEGRFLEAAELLVKAYREDPDPILLSNIGTAYALAGKLEEAKEYLERFLATNPSDWDRQVAEAALAKVNAGLNPAEIPLPPEEPVDPVPWVVAGSGAVTLAVGGLLYYLAEDKRSEVRDAGTNTLGHVTGVSQADAVRLESEADTLAWTSLGVGLVGAGLLAGGLLYALAPDDSPRTDTAPAEGDHSGESISATPTVRVLGTGILLDWSF